jgi:signal transduction histidine kinase/GAF domain-containing protein
LEAGEQLIVELLQRAATPMDQAAVCQTKIMFQTVKSQNSQAVIDALACLHRFGIDLPTHPTAEQLQAEYEAVHHALGDRTTESLVDLPLMSDSELLAAVQLMSVLTPPAYFTDLRLFCLVACRMVNVSMQHGVSDASALGYALFGFILGPVFHRYGEAYRFSQLACMLAEKHGFAANLPKVYHAAGTVAFWTQPIATAIDHMRATFRTATETGDLTFACYGLYQDLTGMLLRNDPLDIVWRQSERALDFASGAKYGDTADIIRSQQRFIATMQGRTRNISSFSDSHFEESLFEAQLTGERMPLLICFYWILKLQARYLAGDFAEAFAAAERVKPVLSLATSQIQMLDYCFYSALTAAACYESAAIDRQAGWRALIEGHRDQLNEWADNYPPTFRGKHTLVCAEIARIERRDADAMRLYEQAVRSAQEQGFVKDEGLAHEIAARFYAARGVDGIAHAYLRNARQCYLRWGAFGKVRQLERLHPRLAEEAAASVLNATIDAPVGQLDVGTVVKASQAVSSEIELGKLIETLMRIALEHAGAARGLLILLTGDELRIAAEATTEGDVIKVTLRNTPVIPSELIVSVLHTALRTRQSVILGDASARVPFSADEYVRQMHVRSVLCLPLLKQGRLVGALHLENNLAPHVFTSARLAVLELLASQAAISLDNVRLYEELRRSEAYLSEAQGLSHTGCFSWSPHSGDIYWTEETFRIFEYDPRTTPTRELLLSRVHPEDLAYFREMTQRAPEGMPYLAYGCRLKMPDERIKDIQVVSRASRTPTGEVEFLGAVMDVTAIRRAENELHKTRVELAHAMRVTSLGELTASIAHEVNQPLGAVMFNAEACMSWLDGDSPNMNEARAALQRIVRDGTRAGEVIRRIRALAKKTDTKMALLSLNDLLSEVLTFVQHELLSAGVGLRLDYASALPVILADKIQLQQLLLNLVMNGIEAMQSITDRPRELAIRSERDGAGRVRVTVADCGIGFSAESTDRLFNTFYTTKPGGMGMGLSICRSIIELHGGRIWAAPNVPHGASIQFTLPLRPEVAGDGA